MMKLERHYTALGVEVLFRHHPKLEEYLKGEFDETLVSKVRLPFHIPSLITPTLHSPRSQPPQQTSGWFTQPISTRTSFSTSGHQRKRVSLASTSQPTCPGKNGA
jgi:hypothetical protein